MRPYIEGTVFDLFDFRFTPDFAGGGGTAASPLDREDEKVVLGRLQLYF